MAFARLPRRNTRKNSSAEGTEGMITATGRVEFKSEDVNLNVSGVGEAFNRLIREAIALPASDLHFNWNEDDVTISVRHLGILRQWSNISREEGSRFITYIKASAGMDVAKRMRPLDGRWVCNPDGSKRVDLRISTIPTLYGEDVAIRLLERDQDLLRIENLGLHSKNQFELVDLLNKPGGLVLVTGPASTGKTTNALCVSPSPQRPNPQDQHDRRPGRVLLAGNPPVPDQSPPGARVSGTSAKRSSPSSGRHHGR